MAELIRKIRRKLLKMRLRPIPVYCQHHVCAQFDAHTMIAVDWMQSNEFKAQILAMQKDGVEFISLSEAYRHISRDLCRRRKYAVITFDDGYSSLMEILPWLEEMKIPCVLFVNGKYLDGKTYRDNPCESYLTHTDLFNLTSPLIEIGSHGWEHTDAVQMSDQAFRESIERNMECLSKHPRYIPFHAYTWGRYESRHEAILQSWNIVPVLIDGDRNYNDKHAIHRVLMR